MPHLPHLRTEPLTFPFTSAALHTGPFNSFNNQCQRSNLMFFYFPGFPNLWRAHYKCSTRERGARADARQRSSIRGSKRGWRQLNSNKQIWVSFTRTFPPAASGLSLGLPCQETGAFLLIGTRQAGRQDEGAAPQENRWSPVEQFINNN